MCDIIHRELIQKEDHDSGQMVLSIVPINDNSIVFTKFTGELLRCSDVTKRWSLCVSHWQFNGASLCVAVDKTTSVLAVCYH